MHTSNKQAPATEACRRWGWTWAERKPDTGQTKAYCTQRTPPLDDRQITRLICVLLKKHLLYDFFGGCFGPPSCCFLI